MADEKPDHILLENVRLSFPQLWKPKAINEGDAEKFGASFLIYKEENAELLKRLKVLIYTVALAEFGEKDKVAEMIKKGKIKLCLHESDSKEYDGYDDTSMFVSASATTRPSVVDRDHSPLVEADGKPYGGCYVNAAVRFWAQNNKWAQRVNCELLGVQFVKDGPAWGKPPFKPEDAFPVLDKRKEPGGATTQEASGKTAAPVDDDEIPF